MKSESTSPQDDTTGVGAPPHHDTLEPRPEEMTPEQMRAERNKGLRWLMLAVAVWGGVLSLGALLFGIDDQGTVRLHIRPARGLIAICCVGGFLGVWLLTDIWGKFRRRRRESLLAAKEAKLAEAAESDAKVTVPPTQNPADETGQ